jgi:hypothetical protein
MKKLLLTAGTTMLALLFTTEMHAQYGGGAIWGSGPAATMPRWSAPPPTRQSVVRRKNVQARSGQGVARR